LSFGSRKPTLTGREANELGATTAVPGVPSREATGSSTESISNCGTIDPKIMRRAGGRVVLGRGRRCLFLLLSAKPVVAKLRSLRKEELECLAARPIARERGAYCY